MYIHTINFIQIYRFSIDEYKDAKDDERAADNVCMCVFVCE